MACCPGRGSWLNMPNDVITPSIQLQLIHSTTSTTSTNHPCHPRLLAMAVTDIDALVTLDDQQKSTIRRGKYARETPSVAANGSNPSYSGSRAPFRNPALLHQRPRQEAQAGRQLRCSRYSSSRQSRSGAEEPNSGRNGQCRIGSMSQFRR